MSLRVEAEVARRQIVGVCRQLHERGWVAACDGNVSLRRGRKILITPGARYKAILRPEEIAEITLDGAVLSGQPSSETAMHLEVYRRCPEAVAVVHAHPPTAIAWSIAFPEASELPVDAVAEVLLATGGIPFVPYAHPGTAGVAEALRPFLPDHRVLVLRRHGALCWGESLEEAYFGIERLEHAATLLMTASMLGGLSFLPKDEVDHLRKTRLAMGPRLL
jgi:L-fuculose-phosphate aldolase